MFKFTKDELVEDVFSRAKEMLKESDEVEVDEYLSRIDLTYEYEGLLKDEAYMDSMRGEEIETPMERISYQLAEQIASQYPNEWKSH